MGKYSEQKDEYLSLHNVEELSDQERVQLVKKLLVFNELIRLLVKWKVEKNYQTEQEVLKDLSFVPLMKCLYIICLLSVHPNKGDLFELFNKFMAYDKGPVDEDCYYYIDNLVDYKVAKDNGKEYIIKKEIPDESFFNTLIPNIALSQIKISIKKELDMLKIAENDLEKALYFPGFRERDELVDLTHRELWKKAYNNKMNKLINTGNKFDLIKEAKEVRMTIAA